MRPIAIDLFCGKGGWAHGLLATGWQVAGFDIADMGGYPGELHLWDVLTLHGSQFREAGLIVASPPCQKYSYMAQPWSLAKKIIAEYRSGARSVEELNALFNACFRIQREAIAATARDCPACNGRGQVTWYCNDVRDCERCYGKGWVTRHIPMVVENVKGAQPWVGRSKTNFGSFHLWGDVETVNGAIWAGEMRFGAETLRCGKRAKCPGQDWNCFKKAGKVSPDWKMQGSGIKGSAGIPSGCAPLGTGNSSWFFGKRADPRDVRRGEDGEWRLADGTKLHGAERDESYSLTIPRPDGTKQGGNWWHDPESMTRRFSSRSTARKEASARIAMIPPPLAEYIGRAFLPQALAAVRPSEAPYPPKSSAIDPGSWKCI